MIEATFLAWCVPLALISLSALFFALSGTIRGASSWASGYALAAFGYALAIVPPGSFGVAKAITEDVLLVFAVVLMVRGLSIRFARPPHDVATALCASVALFFSGLCLVVTESVVLEVAIVQTICAACVLFGAFQMRGKLERAIDKALFTLALALVATLALQTVYVVASEQAMLNLVEWRDTLWAFLFQMTGVLFGLAFAFTALIAMGSDAVEVYRLKSERDALSGLYNRDGFEMRMRGVLGRNSRGGALVVIDLDHFKKVNDSYGHAAGDMVIAGMGAFLESFGGPQFCGRIGGEEFAVFIATNDRAIATRHAAQMQDGLTRIAWPEPWSALQVTASFGIAMARPGDLLDTLYRRADERLYRAKHGGRNRIVTDDRPASARFVHRRNARRLPPPPPLPAIRDAYAP